MCRAFPECGLRVRADWLARRTCVETSTNQTILEKAVECDISDFAEPSGLGEHIKDALHTVHDSVFMQINEIVDASLPQAQREALEVGKNGTMRLVMTDGNHTFVGIAKQRVTLLNPASNPGLKIRLVPPVVMRYGVIFLGDSCIEVLGGYSPKLVAARMHVMDPSASVRAPKQETGPSSFLNSSSDDCDFQSDDDPIENDDRPCLYSTLAELFASDVPEPMGVDVVLVMARIIDCFDFKVMRNKERKNTFHLQCKIVDDSDELLVKVAPLLLNRVAGCKPDEWLSGSSDEKGACFRKCKEYFIGLLPPLFLVRRAAENARDRFLLASEELIDQL